MKDLSRVKFKDGRPYVEYIHKSGKLKGYIKRQYGQIIICQNCEEKCFVEDTQTQKGWGGFCSHGCLTQIGERNHNWKGGKKKTGEGYVLIHKPEHPFCDKDGYMLSHRLVIEECLGRYLKQGEIVHHVNKIKDDNRPKNLIAFKNGAAHNRFERNCPINPEDIIFDGRKIKD